MRLVNGVDFLGICTSDLARSMDWYENVLGLEASKKWQRPGEDPIGAEFETGGLTLALMDSAKFGMEVRPNNHPLALHVDDFEAAKAELESRGVEFKTDVIDSGVCWQAYFEDPDGNSVGIHHRYAPTA
jgi:catechol 2,3-dioxygenase-like lactoylglutathione lyase family enzyme